MNYFTDRLAHGPYVDPITEAVLALEQGNSVGDLAGLFKLWLL